MPKKPSPIPSRPPEAASPPSSPQPSPSSAPEGPPPDGEPADPGIVRADAEPGAAAAEPAGAAPDGQGEAGLPPAAGDAPPVAPPDAAATAAAAPGAAAAAPPAGPVPKKPPRARKRVVAAAAEQALAVPADAAPVGAGGAEPPAAAAAPVAAARPPAAPRKRSASRTARAIPTDGTGTGIGAASGAAARDGAPSAASDAAAPPETPPAAPSAPRRARIAARRPAVAPPDASAPETDPGEPLRILFVTPECAPWVKTGGLGDVSAALPDALARRGHQVRLLLPAFPAFDGLAGRERIAELPAIGDWPAATLDAAPLPSGAALWLLDAPEFFRRDGGPYLAADGADHPDNARRFAFLSHAAARLAQDDAPTGWLPDIVHCNDWTTGLVPLYLRQMAEERGGAAAPAASVMTIHNLAFQGVFPMGWADAIGIAPHWRWVNGAEYWGQLSMLKAGLLLADSVTTVSPTYAREIQGEALGFGLHDVLRSRAAEGDLHGILNGIDTASWDPAQDRLLPHPFDRDDLHGKALTKAALQWQFGLADDPEALLFGVVSRLTGQKGIDLIVEALPWLVAQGHQVVVQGQGDAELEQALRDAAAANPSQVAVRIGFDESTAHRIEAGADCFLMPSRYEPCGLNQMYSQRYGTLPLVHATGGLADSVTDAAGAADGTGFVIPEATPEALRAGLERVAEAWADPRRWAALQRRAMERGFGWRESARDYVRLYREIAARPQRRARPG
jgi:starch synthase